MKNRVDFLEYLENDVSLKILMFLNDPADLIRASAVSWFWRHLVIASGIFKHLCLRKFPQLSKLYRIVEPKAKSMDNLKVESSGGTALAILERDHKVHASLFKFLFKSKQSPRNFMLSAISASSTDHDPIESIYNTLKPQRHTYWSSKGNSDQNASETLIYSLNSGISIVTEINIQPYEAYYPGDPMYSAKSVLFRMGHQNFPGNFGWTYTSPEFPVNQVVSSQQFKLPEPVLCIGGFLQIELLGMVHKADNGLFYVCISYASVVGLPLEPAFDLEILKPSGEFLLNYHPEFVNSTLNWDGLL